MEIAEWLNRIDTWLLLLINGVHSSFADRLMGVMSSKPAWIPLYLIMLILLIIRYKKKAWKYVLVAALVAIATDQASVHLFKNVFHRLRPCWEPELQGMIRLVSGKCGGMYGFVSSHAANTFGFATFISFTLRKHYRWIPWLMFAWAFLVCYSRVYLGVHYPGDVLVGAALGFAMGWLGYRLMKLKS